jgi:hypothetical protein
MGQTVAHNVAEAQRMSTQGYVLGPTEGEQLIRNAGSYLIKVDFSRGSNNMALGTQKVPMHTGILVHQHQEADEVLFVLEGTGFGILDDTRMPVERVRQFMFPRAFGMELRIPTVNYYCFGSWHHRDSKRFSVR